MSNKSIFCNDFQLPLFLYSQATRTYSFWQTRRLFPVAKIDTNLPLEYSVL